MDQAPGQGYAGRVDQAVEDHVAAEVDSDRAREEAAADQASEGQVVLTDRGEAG